MSIPDRLYLDHAATTPVLPAAREAIASALESWANPSSPHADGRRARAALEDARRRIAHPLGWRHDVILTSGASEAIQIAVTRSDIEAGIAGATEHEAVLAAFAGTARLLGVDADGQVDLEELARLLERQRALVAVQLVNNETGVIQPIERIYELVRAAGSLLLCDCAQAAGKITFPEADFIAVSGHKFGGPPGTGALLVRNLDTLAATGGQERGYRRGTENVPGAAGMAAALETGTFLDAMPRLRSLRRYLEQEIVASGGQVIASGARRIATIGAYSMPAVQSASQLVQLDLAGISVSAGSACSSGSMKASRVLSAMRIGEDIASCVIRVSFGPATSATDIERLLTEWRKIAERAKAEAA